MEEFKRQEITMDVVKTFMEGHDPEERIVDVVANYRDPFVKVYYRNENDDKCVTERPFYPFVWAKKEVCVKMKKYIMENGLCLEEFNDQLQQAIEDYLAAGGDRKKVEKFIQKPNEE